MALLKKLTLRLPSIRDITVLATGTSLSPIELRIFPLDNINVAFLIHLSIRADFFENVRSTFSPQKYPTKYIIKLANIPLTTHTIIPVKALIFPRAIKIPTGGSITPVPNQGAPRCSKKFNEKINTRPLAMK